MKFYNDNNNDVHILEIKHNPLRWSIITIYMEDWTEFYFYLIWQWKMDQT